MRNGICPKCGGQAVHVVKYSRAVRYHGIREGWTTMYVCVACGYLEEYFEQQEHRAGIADHWPLVPAAGSPPGTASDAPTRRLPALSDE